MVGAFGLLDDRHHTRFPPDRLIENRARLDVFWLNRIGAFTEGTITELRWGKKPYQLARQTPDIRGRQPPQVRLRAVLGARPL